MNPTTAKSAKTPAREAIRAAELTVPPVCAAVKIALNSIVKRTTRRITTSRIWTSGTSVHAAEICLSASSLPLRSRRRFSTGMLKAVRHERPTVSSQSVFKT